MSLETEVKKLRESIEGLTAAVTFLSRAQPAKSELGEDGVKHYITDEDPAADYTMPAPEGEQPPPPGDAPPATELTLQDLGAYLSEQANKLGAPAQEAIKAIILETGGTQALSQVEAACYPIIKQKVEQWMTANAA